MTGLDNVIIAIDVVQDAINQKKPISVNNKQFVLKVLQSYKELMEDIESVTANVGV